MTDDAPIRTAGITPGPAQDGRALLELAVGLGISALVVIYALADAPGLKSRAERTAPSGFIALLAGWWLALAHLITAVGLAFTIIGLPFAWAHLKLAGIALWPIGKMIVPVDDLRRT